MPKIKTITNKQNFLKLLCGRAVTIGRTYAGLIPVSGGDSENETLKALSYENGTLLLASKDQKYFVGTSGDCASWGGRIVADGISFRIRFQEPVTEKTDFSEIRRKNYRVPRAVMDAICAAVGGVCPG